MPFPYAHGYSYVIRIAYSYAVRVATEHDHRPIWALPQPADRKPRYTREQIAAAALRIADQEGFDAVTMKRIAAELGAATMTLYYYVRNKSRHRRADAGRDPRRHPRPGRVPARRLAGRHHRDRPADQGRAHGPPLVAGVAERAQFGPNAMRHFEQSLAAVASTGLALPPGSSSSPPSTTTYPATPCTPSSRWPAPRSPRKTRPWSPPRSHTASPGCSPATSLS